MEQAGLPVTGKGVRPHLRGSKDKGRDERRNPAVAEVKDGEPRDALHDDDVGQEEEEEQVVALEQIHILSSLLEVPEVLGDLSLLTKNTEKGIGCLTTREDRCLEHRTPFRSCGKRGQSTPPNLQKVDHHILQQLPLPAVCETGLVSAYCQG